MADRTYTVREIDDLRQLVENKYLFGSYTLKFAGGRGGHSRAYREDEKVKVVEDQVRTFMLAGLTADDLRKSEQE